MPWVSLHGDIETPMALTLKYDYILIRIKIQRADVQMDPVCKGEHSRMEKCSQT